MLHPKQRLFLSILSGILLSLPWYESFSGFFIFIAFVPLLLLEDSFSTEKTSNSAGLFWHSSLCFLIWNICTTWWISNATFAGVVTVVTLNTVLFSVTFWLYHISNKTIGKKFGKVLLIFYWVAFEYLYLNAEVSWPWLNLGHGLANSIKYIQFYEYTGVLGGTLWILMVNVLLAALVSEYLKKRIFNYGLSILAIFCIAGPVLLSVSVYNNYKEESHPVNIVIVQPNIDPYSEKFNSINASGQLNIILEEAQKGGIIKTHYFIAPETAILGENDENKLDTNWAVKEIRSFLKEYAKASFVIGAETVREIGNKSFERYNSALQINKDSIQIYHKSKLVLGVETMPYSKYLRSLEKYSLKLGGSFGSLGSQDYREVFASADKNTQVAPVICYESAFGEFVTDYLKKDANLIFVLTNDGWFGNTAGHRQHLSYAQIRAIETRRSIARSANTGISAFINQRGEIIQSLGWWKRGTLTGSLNTNTKQTFYVIHGDYLGRIAFYISLIFILITLWLRYRRRVKT